MIKRLLVAWRASMVRACMVIGHQKDATRKSAPLRNLVCRNQKGYRKAMRLMKLVEKILISQFSPLSTPLALGLGLSAEERGQSEAIGHNFQVVMAESKVPLITTIIGEGGSGEALWQWRLAMWFDVAICNLLGDFSQRVVHRSYGKPLSGGRCRRSFGLNGEPLEGQGFDR